MSDTIDRRQNDQWIRDGMKENKDEILALRKDFSDFTNAVLSAIPHRSPKAHLTAHEQLEQDMAERRAKIENDAKLKLEVRNGLVKTGINALIVFICGIFLLGAQAQFGIWVDKAQSTKVVVESTKVVK